MAPEYQPPADGIHKEGHLPRTETAMLELYRLMSTFLASKGFADLRTHYPGEGHDPIYLLQECEEDEITRILLMLAVTARVIDDREGRIYDLVGGTCGTLQKDVSKAFTEELTLREACNKIIHAKKIRFDIEENGKGQVFFNPVIYMYGTHGGLEWKTTLDVIAFAKEYASCISYL